MAKSTLTFFDCDRRPIDDILHARIIVDCSRVQAWRIIHTAAVELDIAGKIAPHSLRKTFGYFAWNGGDVPVAVIMKIYNHSNFAITMRYLGIEQDDLDNALLNIELI